MGLLQACCHDPGGPSISAVVGIQMPAGDEDAVVRPEATSTLRCLLLGQSPAKQSSGSEDCLGDHPQRFGVGIAAEQHAIDVPLFPGILPSLQPVANAISRTDERNLIDQSIGHSGYRLRLSSGEESILDPNCRRLVPHALCSVVVEILVAGAHTADIEGKVLLDR